MMKPTFTSGEPEEIGTITIRRREYRVTRVPLAGPILGQRNGYILRGKRGAEYLVWSYFDNPHRFWVDRLPGVILEERGDALVVVRE